MAQPCKSCGADVIWKQITNDKGARQWQCFNVDGVTTHWDQCSKRRWEQVKATGERFERKRASGYANSVHGTKYDLLVAPVMRGKIGLSGNCRDCVPPGEVCPAVCPEAMEVRT